MAGQQEIDITVIVFGTMGMLLLALGLVVFVVFYQKNRIRQQAEKAERENRYQRELLKAAIEVKEKEQERIAHELHDDIGSALTHIKMRLRKDHVEAEEIAKVRELLQEVVGQVRDISHALLPPVLDELGLNGAIRNLCRRLNEQGNIQIDCQVGQGRIEAFTKDTELAIYRIVQELLNNILKHAGATEISVKVELRSPYFILTIEDNGKGFVPPEKLDLQSRSLGMKNLASRVLQIDAELNYELRKPQGTRVILKRKIV